MAKVLTLDEWAAQKPPLFWTDTNGMSWSAFQSDIALKWAEQNGGTWVHRAGNVLVFGSEEDRLMFQLWARENITDASVGSL